MDFESIDTGTQATLGASSPACVAPDTGQVSPGVVRRSTGRGPGRPKGTPKTGGRKRGTPNRDTAQTRDRIKELGDPIGFLSDVMSGKRMVCAGEPGDQARTWAYPTIEQRIKAGETLLRKLLPDLKATELTGAEGAPLILPPTRREELVSSAELARRMAFLLAKGAEAKRELDAGPPDTIIVEPEPSDVALDAPEDVPEPEEEPDDPLDDDEPALPPHAHITIEAGERERSGDRVWFACAGAGSFLKAFHGPDARQKARAWVADKYSASPAAEIEHPLPE